MCYGRDTINISLLVFRHQEYMILITAYTELHSVGNLLDTGHCKLKS